ncbi:hypothetical protein SAMN06265222_102172 [Neorhodopirellula lusitana]|uniref:Uncharacterized protein n=1 Tax=Neorhodopirellula lusitana TaxID=445327 RepID=A0ABY1PTA0_9BACT|nr:hypothetical protein [Neorhodopirellula lusitana]SMP46755.1 hypothetical protein SAMN06265222_102172 [Neorhodopirellula lusitana]
MASVTIILQSTGTNENRLALRKFLFSRYNMPMARIGIVFGLLLCGLTIAGLSVTTQKSYTQFIPMMFGIPMLFLGVVSLNPHRREGAVSFATGLAALGTLLGGGRLFVLALQYVGGGYVNPISLRLVVVMTGLCLIFALVAWIWQKQRKRDSTSQALSAKASNPTPETTVTLKPPPVTTDNPYQTPPILPNSTDDRGIS